MKHIQVDVQVKPKQYHIAMGNNLFRTIAADLLAQPLGKQYALITDSTVAHLWADKLQAALQAEGLKAQTLIMPAGEVNKTRQTKEALEDAMLQAGMGRDSAVLALGGGVVGDVAGYVAATYMRGIPVVQIPTTTLSMADSSVGGKTGVDTPQGKNLIGAFHHPEAVYMDMQTLQTQDERNYRAGLAEVVKHGFIYDPAILSFLEAHRESVLQREPAVLEELFVLNCQVKNRVVAQDDQEKGLRQILNYGHTLGHAVEMLAGFSLIHGECVSIGMVFAAAVAVQMGLCAQEWADRQRAVLEALQLPVHIPASLAAEDLIGLMKMDKKARDGKIQFVLPVEPGVVRYGMPVSETELLSYLKGGL